MNTEPEQIGPLRFAPNPDYPYPFEVPLPPHFWMDEQTGTLATAVEVYLRNDPLTTAQLDLLRLYVRQYLERAVIAADANRKKLLTRLDRLRNVNELHDYVEELAEWGVEPF
jgi:hypothetical protein